MDEDDENNSLEENKKELLKAISNLPIYLKAIDIYDTMLLLSDNIFSFHRNANDGCIVLDNNLIGNTKELILFINSMERSKVVFRKYNSTEGGFENLMRLRLFFPEFENRIDNIWDMHNSPELYETLKKEYAEFKLLYVDWIKTFDYLKEHKDDWGFSIVIN